MPTVFEDYVSEIQLDGQKVELRLKDTAGQEDYDRLRPLAYPQSHVILICFAIDSSDSLENVQIKVSSCFKKVCLLTKLIRDGKWIEEVKHFCPTQPILLVGCKSDLRNDPKTLEYVSRSGEHMVTQQEVCRYLFLCLHPLKIPLHVSLNSDANSPPLAG